MRAAAYLLTVGGVSMLIGGIIKRTSGGNLDAYLTNQDIPGYLAHISGSETALFVNLSLWIAGAFLIGAGGYLLSRHVEHPLYRLAGASYLIGAPLAIGSFVIWMALIRLGENGASAGLTGALGFVASRADWVATVLLVGLAPVLLSVTDADGWLPRWLKGLGIAAGTAGALTVIAMYAGGLSTYGSILVPVGIVWTLGAAVAAFRHSTPSQPKGPKR